MASASPPLPGGFRRARSRPRASSPEPRRAPALPRTVAPNSEARALEFDADQQSDRPASGRSLRANPRVRCGARAAQSGRSQCRLCDSAVDRARQVKAIVRPGDVARLVPVDSDHANGTAGTVGRARLAGPVGLLGAACDADAIRVQLARRGFRNRGEPAVSCPMKAAARRLRSASRDSACASSGRCTRPAERGETAECVALR